MSGRKIIVIITSIFGVLLLGILLNFLIPGSNKTTEDFLHTSNSTVSSNGMIGYVILKGPSIYFLAEDDLDEGIDSINWDELSQKTGHPSSSKLFGDALKDIKNELATGDKVEIWYSRILESYPAQIEVKKIKIHNSDAE